MTAEYPAHPKESERQKPLPDFHDCSVVGIVVTPNKESVLIILDQVHAIHHVVLTGILRQKGDNFLEGNVILELRLVPSDEVDEAAVLATLSMKEAGAYQTFIDRTMERIRNHDLLLVQMSSSYGFTLSCLCTEATVDNDRGRTLLQQHLNNAGDR